MKLSKRNLMVGVALILVLIAVQGATAQEEEVIYGCYHKTNGNLRIVESPEDCKTQEIAIWWNVVGPPGPEGPPGELSGVQRIQLNSPMDSISPKSVQVLCPAGKVATGGGYNINGGALNIAVGTNAPLASGPSYPPFGWGITAYEIVPMDTEWQIFGFVVCADGS